MPSSLHTPVTAFFRDYEAAVGTGDPAALGNIYHTSFLFGGLSGAQTVQLDDFLKVIPQRSGFIKSLGLTGTQLVSVTASALDGRYTLAKVVWGMSRGVAEETRTFEARATYVLLNTAEGLRIVAQIDHADLVAELRR